jgi:hypothetical protein
VRRQFPSFFPVSNALALNLEVEATSGTVHTHTHTHTTRNDATVVNYLKTCDDGVLSTISLVALSPECVQILSIHANNISHELTAVDPVIRIHKALMIIIIIIGLPLARTWS